nr:hypothetical protein Iba_chr07bCG4610 [Ipomoea batatas]
MEYHTRYLSIFYIGFAIWPPFIHIQEKKSCKPPLPGGIQILPQERDPFSTLCYKPVSSVEITMGCAPSLTPAFTQLAMIVPFALSPATKLCPSLSLFPVHHNTPSATCNSHVRRRKTAADRRC